MLVNAVSVDHLYSIIISTIFKSSLTEALFFRSISTISLLSLKTAICKAVFLGSKTLMRLIIIRQTIFRLYACILIFICNNPCPFNKHRVLKWLFSYRQIFMYMHAVKILLVLQVGVTPVSHTLNNSHKVS